MYATSRRDTDITDDILKCKLITQWNPAKAQRKNIIFDVVIVKNSKLSIWKIQTLQSYYFVITFTLYHSPCLYHNQSGCSKRARLSIGAFFFNNV